MSPRNVIHTVKEMKIDIIALTDHNTFSNCDVYEKVCRQNDVVFIYGVEIQTAEDIHLIALFANRKEAMAFNDELYRVLPNVKNNPDFFGDQVIIDENENIVRFEDKVLINSIAWTLDETCKQLDKYDCFYYPAHINAETYSIIGQLGFIPPDLNFSALEITAKCELNKFLNTYPHLGTKTFIRSSDAHYLNEIGSGFTRFYLEEPTIKEMRFACQNIGDRKTVL